MDIKRSEKEAFAVIGKLGATSDGPGFIERLWTEANQGYGEIEALVKKDENGAPVGLWGAMSDPTGSLAPWEDGYTRGLYLAGAEAEPNALPPPGWVKWTIPASEWLYARVEGDVPGTFTRVLAYLQAQGLAMAGAANDYTCPAENGQAYIVLPLRRL